MQLFAFFTSSRVTKLPPRCPGSKTKGSIKPLPSGPLSATHISCSGPAYSLFLPLEAASLQLWEVNWDPHKILSQVTLPDYLFPFPLRMAQLLATECHCYGGGRRQNWQGTGSSKQRKKDFVFVDSSLPSDMECPKCTPRSWTWDPALPTPTPTAMTKSWNSPQIHPAKPVSVFPWCLRTTGSQCSLGWDS